MNLTAQGITKEFPRKSGSANCFTALHPVDLTLRAGTLTVLTGRSGSGKSTLLHILGGLLQPTAGRVLADEHELSAMSDRALSSFRNAHIGMIPQGQTAVYSLNVQENVLLPLTLCGRAEERDRKRAGDLLRELGIGSLAECRPSELSGGELRRMSIARALARQPDIVLADEPTSDLDAENSAIVWNALRQAAQNGAAVLTVTHEQNADMYADYLYTMQNGQLEGSA